MSDATALVIAVLLLAANAFFVGAEFALVSARRSQIEPLAQSGSRMARSTLRAMENVSLMMAGAQLGITICSVGLGAVGEPAVAHLIEPLFERAGVTEALVHPVAFVVALVAFGRLRGVTALVGLGVTFLVLVLFVVPAILGGDPPLLIAIVGSAAVALTVLYLTHGFTPSTSVAVLGTLAALALTGLLSALAVATMHLTGFTDDLSAALGQTYAVNMEGLLLAGIVIGSLGVLDDVTVTQAATVAELSRANPEYRGRDLYRAGSRVGRSHIASVVNTIVLAYAGSSLPLLILIVANNDGLGNVLTDQIVAQEIVRSLVATIGLVAAVPVTTALAALSARGRW